VIFACFSGIPAARETFRSSELVVGSSPASGPTQPSFLCSAQRCLADGYSRQAKLESSSFLSQSDCISVHHGSISGISLQSLRNPKALPFEAIKAATVHRERVAPLLIQELQKFAADFQGYDRNDCLPVIAIYLLAEWQVDISPKAIPKDGRCDLVPSRRRGVRIERCRVNG